MQEFLEYIGVEGEDLDTLKAKFEEKFITKEQALSDESIRKHHFGTAYKGFDNVLGRSFSDIIPPEELEKAEKTADKIQLLRAKIDEQTAELNSRLESNKKPSEREAELTKSIEDLKSQLSLKENGLKEWETKYTEAENQFKTELTNIRTSQAFQSEVVSLLQISDQKDEFWKKGFFNEMQGKYLVEHNGEKLVIRNRADGTPIPNPKKHGEELTPFEVYNNELELCGGKKKNEGSVNGTTTVRTTATQPTEVKGHPRFQNWAN